MHVNPTQDHKHSLQPEFATSSPNILGRGCVNLKLAIIPEAELEIRVTLTVLARAKFGEQTSRDLTADL